MMNMAEMLMGDAPPPPTPKWMVGRHACPILRGKELWWMGDGMMVAGSPPAGVTYGHDDPHIIPADYGPVGDPVQIVPRTEDVQGQIACLDLHNDTRARIDGRIYRFLTKHADAALKWFCYPELEEGSPQMVAVFRHWIEAPDGWQPNGLDPHRPPPADMMRNLFDVYAFVEQRTFNLNYFLDHERLEDVPRFAGDDEIEGMHRHGR